jgi:hypothetical protein
MRSAVQRRPGPGVITIAVGPAPTLTGRPAVFVAVVIGVTVPRPKLAMLTT